ncbi:hypothetical protein [Gordonia rhizosphera]|uniref:Uncharacterized protein n=1 Tax=Gordonia rhizosphera NBRC 16068 TaxID=1108045 RepID=K6W3A2_9ACTN|nr:hypothetical protein [Gordonia rhizosphera]GAB93640.1 hypothetical protein GORHZ_233_00520 [Gordonia rhizosphera NBRC 16068]
MARFRSTNLRRTLAGVAAAGVMATLPLMAGAGTASAVDPGPGIGKPGPGIIDWGCPGPPHRKLHHDPGPGIGKPGPGIHDWGCPGPLH